MRYVQGMILAALVVIAGLLFSISRKMGAPAPAPAMTATAAPQTPAEPAPAAQPVAAAPAPAPAIRVPARRLASRPVETRPAETLRRDSDSIPRPRNPEPEYVATASAYPPPPAVAAPPPPPPVRTITVPAGTAVTIRLLDRISTESNRPGDTFQGTLDEPLMAEGLVVAPRGSGVTGRVVHAQQSGRVAGLAELALELDRVQTVGGEVQIASDTTIRRAESSKGKDAVTVGALAGIGAAIGAIAGGRKGAGIGAAAGGATGTATVVGTRGKPVTYEPETRLSFRLRAPITVTADGGRLQPVVEDPDRPRLYRRP